MIELIASHSTSALIGALITWVWIGIPSPQQPPPEDTTECPHQWEPWSKPRTENLHDFRGIFPTKIGVVITQQRTCLICGELDYSQETHTT